MRCGYVVGGRITGLRILIYVMNVKRRRFVTAALWLLLVVVGVLNVFMQFVPSTIHCDTSLQKPYPLVDTVTTALLNKKNRSLSIASNINNHVLNHKQDFVFDCVTWLSIYRIDDIPTNDFSITSFDHWKGPSEERSHRLKTFKKIFEKRDWLASDPKISFLQASGPGALLVNAQNAIAALHVIISRLKSVLNKQTIKLLDLPCGDLQWIRLFLVSRTDVEYHGMDIVPAIIQQHKKKFGHVKRLRFSQIDIVNNALNESYDLILCRDMVQHLTVRDAGWVLQHFSDSGSSFLLATTHPDSTANTDIDTVQLGARFSRYNLEVQPFSLAPPVCSGYDYNREHLALWPLPLQQKLFVADTQHN